MIRNLKILIAAAMALTAFGAISASGAQAAEFHCSVEPCTVTIKPDGAAGSKQAHQVFIVKQGENSVSTTCNTVSAHATSAAKTTTTITVTKILYGECNVAGAPSTVKMNECHYHIVAFGPIVATVQVQCPAGKVIEIETTETKCLITIGSTGVLGGGLKLKDAETGGVKKTEITAEASVTGIPTTVANNKCPAPLKEGAATGDYTTGNVEITGETDSATPVHANIWWE